MDRPILIRSFLNLITVAISALAMAVLFIACDRSDKKQVDPPEKITIAFSATTDSVLAEVAYAKGYFLQEGLEVTPRLHPYGKRALDDMLAGKADFATVAETPVMFAILKGAKISIVATIQTSDSGNAVLARKDAGVLKIGDLKGKKIAATLGTTSDFFLDTILSLNGISRKDMHVVDMKAEEMAAAIDRGDIDAVSTFAPYVAYTQRKLGNRALTFQDQDIYRWTFTIVSTQEFIRQKPDAVRKMLRALLKAEEFVRNNPAEAQLIVSDFDKVEIDLVRDVWADTNFELSLDQALVLSLEDETRWAINNRLTGAGKIPNYLDFIYFDGLGAVKPERVRILR
jgi:ABC-type nitrate/sulfonate/bicarbonate transport system substrate-binding protein